MDFDYTYEREDDIAFEKDTEMDREKNLLLAKKYMVESIYRAANIEGIGMTFPETQVICEGLSVSGHTIDEINAVVDLKKAYQWVLSNTEQPICNDVLCTINRITGKYTVINAGSFRDIYDEPIRVPVHNGGNYYPPMPEPKQIETDLVKITENKSLDGALDMFCYVCKAQAFNDGNKRTATLITNLFMLQNGLGIFSIPVDKKLEFYNALASYYENEESKPLLKAFLRDNCITGG